jgi:hypothetical protein
MAATALDFRLSEKLPPHFMFGTSDPNQIVAGLGVGFLLLARLWRFILWVRESPQKNGNIQHRTPINREQASNVKWIAR